MLKRNSVDKIITMANSYAKKGNFHKAKNYYQEVLNAFPKNNRAIQGLETLRALKQNNDVILPPQNLVSELVNLYNKGKVFLAIQKGQYLSNKYPDSFIIWNILGACLAQVGMFKKAIEAYKNTISINPNYVYAYCNMGIVLKDQGKLNEAISIYQKAISIKPNYAEAYSNLGVVYRYQGRLDEAIIEFQKAILLKPNFFEAYNNMGNVFQDQKKLDEAIKAYKMSISLNPAYIDAYNNLGNTLKELGKLEDSIQAFKKALNLKPDHAEVINNLGLAIQDQGKIKEAIELFKKSIMFKPKYSNAYINLGIAFKDQGHFDDAIETYKNLISFEPNFAEAHQNLSFIFLNNNKLKEGLEKYEWRWNMPKFPKKRCFTQPQWDGKTNLKDKRILIWCEQGIGDTLNWSSRLPILSSKAKKCILECQEKLVPLLKRSFPDIEVKSENKDFDTNRNDFDFHLPMGSLYKHLLKEIKKSPKVDPYLLPDPNRVKYWKKRLSLLGKGPYIGICWKSSVVSNYRSKHYPTILKWAPILKIPEVKFINLQYIDFENDLNKIQNTFGVKVHNFEDLDQFNDIDNLTALSAALDFVVSTKITPSIISSGVGTVTKIANWKQSNFNNILLNPVSSSVDIINRNTWETWDNVFNLIAKKIIKIKNENKYY